jgi:endonuclease III
MIKKVNLNVNKIITVLKCEVVVFNLPLINQIIIEFGHDPYLILISCLLSLRAKDIVTIHVCRRLFSVVQTPQEMLDLKKLKLEEIVFKAGFYKVKASVLHEVSAFLVKEKGGRVPNTLSELLSIKGVGRKTANLVLGVAYKIPSICVDIHVYRISNRLGITKSSSPKETEKQLKQKISKNFWIEWNRLLVTWGQNICMPVSPKCSSCAVKHFCKKVGVIKSR